MKKDGADMPMMLEKTAVVSSQVLCFTADKTPSGIPMSMAINMAAIANISVPGRACIKTDVTGFLV